MSNLREIGIQRKPTLNKIGGKNMSKLSEVGDLIRYLLEQDEQPMLVVSAFEGITNKLLTALHVLHTQVDYQEMDIDAAFSEAKTTILEVIDKYFNQDEDYIKQAKALVDAQLSSVVEPLVNHKNAKTGLSVNEKNYQIRDQVIALGETTARGVLKIYLEEQGIEAAEVVDVQAEKFVNTNGVEAAKRQELLGVQQETLVKLNPLLGESDVAKMADLFSELLEPAVVPNRTLHQHIQNGLEVGLRGIKLEDRNKVLIFGGHIPGTPRGIAVDVGRSYSDTTALDLMVALSAITQTFSDRVAEAVFWKDVDGYLTGDSKKMADSTELGKRIQARLVTDLSYKEALELATAGSMLLQTESLILAEREGVRLRIKNMADPRGQGTTIDSTKIVTPAPFKSISTQPCDVISFECPAMATESGFLETLSAAFSKYRISVNDTPSGGIRISFTVSLPGDELALEALRKSLREITSRYKTITINGQLYETGVTWEQGATGNVAVVGAELSNRPGILSQITAVLAAYNINIKAVAQADSETKISFYVDERNRLLALRIIHAYFIDKDKEVHAHVMARTKELALTFA